ncbi:hypothetical protein K7432_010480, partial [Basidiobolus ranarum]
RELLSILNPVIDGSFQHVWSTAQDNTTDTIDNPEYWGTIEFSELTTIDPEYHRKHDPQRLARHVLMEVYHAQREYFVSHGRYPSNLNDLRAREHRIIECGKIPKITLSKGKSRYIASVRSGERIGRVREDRFLWFSKK